MFTYDDKYKVGRGVGVPCPWDVKKVEPWVDVLKDLNKLLTNPQPSNYPPYNLTRTATGQRIEVALAGFNKSDITITKSGENKVGYKVYTLTITGKKATEETNVEGETSYHKGIARREFTKVFTYQNDFTVDSAEMVDGMLVVNITDIVPEDIKPVEIKIGGKR